MTPAMTLALAAGRSWANLIALAPNCLAPRAAAQEAVNVRACRAKPSAVNSLMSLPGRSWTSLASSSLRMAARSGASR